MKESLLSPPFGPDLHRDIKGSGLIFAHWMEAVEDSTYVRTYVGLIFSGPCRKKKSFKTFLFPEKSATCISESFWGSKLEGWTEEKEKLQRIVRSFDVMKTLFLQIVERKSICHHYNVALTLKVYIPCKMSLFRLLAFVLTIMILGV